MATTTERISSISKYRYKGVDKKTGSSRSGTANATSVEVVIQELERQGITPISVTAAKTASGTGDVIEKRPNPRELAAMARELSVIINVITDPVEQIDVLLQSTNDWSIKEALKIARNDVINGVDMPTALARHPNVFPETMTSMMRAGFEGNIEGDTMAEIAMNMERDNKMRSQIRGALYYPAGAFLLAIGVGIFITLYTIPMLKDLYVALSDDSDVVLPLPTRVMIFFTDYAWIIIPVIVGLMIWAFIWWRNNHTTERYRRKVDPWKLKVPVLGKQLFHKIALVKFTRNYYLLRKAKVEPQAALKVTIPTINNLVIEDALWDAYDKIALGEQLGTTLKEYPELFPPTLAHMVSTGEKVNQDAIVIEKMADRYQQDVDEVTKAMQSILEPIITLTVLGIVAFIAISLLAPYYGLAQTLGT